MSEQDDEDEARDDQEDEEEDDVTEEGTFSIRIVDEDGNGVGGIDVYIEHGLGILHSHREETDSDGWAEFPLLKGSISDSLTVDVVMVNGVRVNDDYFTPEDGDTFSYTISE